MAENQQTGDDDLQLVIDKMNQFIHWVGYKIYLTLKFIKKNIIALLLIIVGGYALGYFLDYIKPQHYDNEVVLIANFNSQDYVYAKVDNFDRNQMKAINPIYSDVTNIEIEPIEDIISMIEGTKKETLEAYKLLIERGVSIDNIKEDKQLLKNNKFHKLTIQTNDDKNSAQIVDDFLKTLNDNDYLNEKREVEKENTIDKIKILTTSLTQIDSLVQSIRSGKLTGKNELSVNNYNQLSDLISLKNYFSDVINDYKLNLVEYKQAIYPTSKNINIKAKSGLLSYKFLLPFLLIFLFLTYKAIIALFKTYKKQ